MLAYHVQFSDFTLNDYISVHKNDIDVDVFCKLVVLLHPETLNAKLFANLVVELSQRMPNFNCRIPFHVQKRDFETAAKVVSLEDTNDWRLQRKVRMICTLLDLPEIPNLLEENRSLFQDALVEFFEGRPEALRDILPKELGRVHSFFPKSECARLFVAVVHKKQTCGKCNR